MSTQASAPYLLGRVGVRAGVGLWRHRGAVLLATVVSVVLGGYASMTWSGELPTSLVAGSSVANGDCADTAMAAVADKSTSAAQRAYQCMDTTFQQRVTEQAFTQQMQAAQLPTVNKLARVGDYHSPGGGT